MRAWLAAVALYLLVTPAMVSPVIDLRHPGRATYGGDALWAVWTLAWNNHVVLDGAPSYFDANIFHPARRTLARNEHLFAPALATLPVYAATRNALLAYDVIWLASFPLCALAVFGLASIVTREFAPRAIAGLVYAFAFWRYERAIHIQYLWTFALPLSLWALYGWQRGRRPWLLVLWTLLVLMQALTSWYMAVLCLVGNGLWLLWLLFTPARASAGAPPHAESSAAAGVDWLRVLVSLAAAWAVVLAVLWLFARPYFSLAGGHPDEVLINSAGWRSYLEPPRATLTGQWLLRRGVRLPPWNFETMNFLGFTVLLLAATGVVAAWRSTVPIASRRTIAFFLALAIVSLVLSLGPSADAVHTGRFDWTPFGLLARTPGMRPFRAPARFALLVVLALSLLSAAGAAYVARRRHGRILLLLAALLILLETRPVAYDIGRPHPVSVPRIYVMLRDLPPGPVLSLPAFSVPPENWFDADYMFFATVHWKPIMNGYSRTPPPGHIGRMEAVAGFPSPEALATLRTLGVRYVVTHAYRYGVNLRSAIAAAQRSPDVELLARDGDDYLWRVK